MPSPKSNALQRLKSRTRAGIDDFRYSLSYIDALPQLTILGLFSGLAAAGVIVLFRLLVDGSLIQLLGERDNFEALPALWRFGLPFGGALIIGLGWHMLDRQARSVGVSHVLDRLHHHQGKLPFRSLVAQFFGGALSLISGQSVGREGPAVHLGAGAASLLGQWLRLPHNSLRTLVGCGVAAAIAASFNTPMAGVIFAMEVVLMEYTIASFLPVILASVSGAVVTQLVFGEDPSFSVTPVQMKSLLELPFMALAGAVIALVALVFTRLHLALYRSQQLPILVRFTTIGALTGALALVVPEVMGLGYDTLEAAMLGELGLQVLLAVVLAKTVASAVSTGLGMPGGLIGPILVIGGCVGGVMGNLGEIFYPEHASGAGFYVTLGMAAMMGAVLNAPLAALMAILELTYNPNAIFPSMVVIVVASVFTQQIFGCEGIFRAQLRALGTPLSSVPAQQVLSRAGVLSVMNRSFVITERRLSLIAAHALLEKTPTWIVLDEPDNPAPDSRRSLLRAADLAKYLDSYQPELNEITEEGEAVIDLAEIPGQRYKLYSLHPQANLYEARELLRQSYGEAICIEEVESSTPLRSPVLGIVTPGEIDNYYGPVR
ncbi:chloride channel protein [Gilvimarinus sp. F26214L]|uniref:chloride channel protein n=1 Tax=Gilvimarinus sp. DZF01 TaxID=3461371 RepID=UPI004045F840